MANPLPTSDPADIVLPAEEVDKEFIAFRKQIQHANPADPAPAEQGPLNVVNEFSKKVKSALDDVTQALDVVDAAIEAAEKPESRAIDVVDAIAKAERGSDRKRAASSPASHALANSAPASSPADIDPSADRKRARDDGAGSSVRSV